MTEVGVCFPEYEKKLAVVQSFRVGHLPSRLLTYNIVYAVAA